MRNRFSRLKSHRGKIIGIVGCPASGKSLLAKQLAKEFSAETFFEGEAMKFPERIVENLGEGKRPLETCLWFHQNRFDDYLKASEFRRKGRTVVMDTFWLTNRFYFPSRAQMDEFERQLAMYVELIDQRVFDWPDVVIYIRMSREQINQFVHERGRPFETTDRYIEHIYRVNDEHEKFFNQYKRDNLIVIDHAGIDFKNPEHVQGIVEQVLKFKVSKQPQTPPEEQLKLFR